MKLQKYLIVPLLIFAAAQIQVSAQDYTDLLRYSQIFNQSTARSSGAGNAFGALGGDPVSMTINPAGIGIYRKNEFSVGAAITRPNSTATYLGSVSQDDKYNLNIGNIGLVFANVRESGGKPVTSGWVGVNWALGFNRTNTFHRRVFIEGINTENTALEDWANQANGRTEQQLNDDVFGYGSMAYFTSLLQSTGPLTYRGLHESENRQNFKVFQEDEIGTRGAMNDINLSVSGNYSNKLYIGGSLMVPTIGYHHSRIFRETNISDSARYYRKATLYENINTTGLGISGNIGVIYRFSDNIRAGASIRLPTFYSLTDEYNYTMESEVDIGGIQNLRDESPLGQFKYSLVTPWRGTLSAAYIINKNGFISMDYEFVDYTDARINSDYEGARATNRIVQQYFKPNGNIRLGTEWKYEAFAFRGGFGYFGSPFSEGLTPNSADASTKVYSLGLGYRDADAYVDVSYQLQQGTYYHLPYSIPTKNVEGATISDKRTNILLTLGTRF